MCTALLVIWLMPVTSYIAYICAFITIYSCQTFAQFGVHICFWHIFHYVGSSDTLRFQIHQKFHCWKFNIFNILDFMYFWYTKNSNMSVILKGWNFITLEIQICQNYNTSKFLFIWIFIGQKLWYVRIMLFQNPDVEIELYSRGSLWTELIFLKTSFYMDSCYAQNYVCWSDLDIPGFIGCTAEDKPLLYLSVYMFTEILLTSTNAIYNEL